MSISATRYGAAHSTSQWSAPSAETLPFVAAAMVAYEFAPGFVTPTTEPGGATQTYWTNGPAGFKVLTNSPTAATPMAKLGNWFLILG
jgi:hypothetical protein